MKDCLIHQPDLINQLDESYQKRFRKLMTITDNNIPTTRTKSIEEEEIKNYYNNKKQSEDYVQKEKDIVNMILNNSKQLASFINDDFEIQSMEYPTEFGRVDLLGFDKDTVYPIEVKLNTGTHSIISQIEKYMRHFWKKLSIKHWKNVKGIVIAQKFDSYALLEFKQVDVIPFSYSINDTGLMLTKL